MRQKRYIKTGNGRESNFPPAAIPDFIGGRRGRKIRFEPVVAVIFLLFSLWLMFHTFGYDGKNHTILIARTLWSDFGSHIPLIRSFSMGDNWPPEYPLFPGEPIRYHFLFYSFVGLLEKSGLPLDWALNLPSALGFALLLFGIFQLSYHLFHSYRVSALSILFFLFNGSLSFIKFFTRQPLSFRDFPAFGPWDGGAITAFWNLNIYTNQRHLAWGFALGIWFLVWIARAKKPTLIGAMLWGITIGTLPYFHQPMLLIVAILLTSAFLFFPHMRRSLLITGLVSAVLIAPQLLAFPKSPALAWFPGYLIHDRLTVITFLSFWFQNLGFHAILIPIGFFLIPKRAQKVLVPLFFLFAIGNLFKFSPEVAANHKFFNFALILGTMISAYVFVSFARGNPQTPQKTPPSGAFGIGDARPPKSVKHSYTTTLSDWLSSTPWRRAGDLHSISTRAETQSLTDLASSSEVHPPPTVVYQAVRRLVKGAVGVVLVVFLTLSGVIDFFVIVNDTKGALPDVGNNQAATWIAHNTPKDALFLNSSFLYHPASLAGRKVFLGWPYFAWSGGYDTNTRMREMKTMYESKDPKVFCPLLEKYHISYLTVEDTASDPNLPAIDPAYFRSLALPAFTDEKTSLAVYTMRALCGR